MNSLKKATKEFQASYHMSSPLKTAAIAFDKEFRNHLASNHVLKNLADDMSAKQLLNLLDHLFDGVLRLNSIQASKVRAAVTKWREKNSLPPVDDGYRL